MPTYDYVCTNCNYEFEEFQKMSDPVLEVCPQCKGKLRRKIGGGTGLIFKGSGFYITDYKNKNSSGNGVPKKEKTAKPVDKKKTEPAIKEKTA